MREGWISVWALAWALTGSGFGLVHPLLALCLPSLGVFLVSIVPCLHPSGGGERGGSQRAAGEALCSLQK